MAIIADGTENGTNDSTRERRGLPISNERGGVLALTALFLPIAILCVGMVIDLGVLFVAQKGAQAASDLGALAGSLELDWDELAQGNVLIEEDAAEGVAASVTRTNLEGLDSMVQTTGVSAAVANPPHSREPTVSVTVQYKVRTFWLQWLPGFGGGVPGTVSSQASVVRRTKW